MASDLQDGMLRVEAKAGKVERALTTRQMPSCTVQELATCDAFKLKENGV